MHGRIGLLLTVFIFETAALAPLDAMAARRPPKKNNTPSTSDTTVENSSVEPTLDGLDPKVKKDSKKATWSAQLDRSAPIEKRIASLSLSQTNIPVTLLPGNGKLRPLVEIKGEFEKPGWGLFSQKVKLVDEDHVGSERFSLFIYLTGRTNEIVLTAKGPNGEEQSETILILAPDAQEFRIGTRWGEVLVSVGATQLSYFQTAFGNFSSHTTLLALTYDTPRWDSKFGALLRADLTLLNFSPKPVEHPQIISGAMDLTYLLSSSALSNWRKRLLFGASYLTMLPNGSPFGFSNLLSGELGTRVDYSLDLNSAVIGELRYGPLAGIVSLSEYTLNGMLGWTKTLTNFHRVQIDLGLSSLAFKPDPLTVIKCNLLSLRLGYTL